MIFRVISTSLLFCITFFYACNQESESKSDKVPQSENSSLHSISENQEEEKFIFEHISIPSQLQSANPPLLILLHGYGSNEQNFSRIAQNLDPRYHMISVRAPIQLRPNAYAWFGLTWKDGQVIDHNEDEERAANALMLEFIEQLKNNYSINKEAIFIAGFSQGAMMTLNTAFTNPELIKGAAILSGRSCEISRSNYAKQEELKGHAFFLSHGIGDKIIPIEEARKTRSFLDKFPITLSYQEYNMEHSISPQCLSDLNEWLKVQFEKTK